MPSLADFQRDFAVALQGTAEIVPVVPGMIVHRNTATKALVDALLANYPTVEVLMGSAWLAGIARKYAQQYPARNAVLADYGESLPEFLHAVEGIDAWPWLPDVAALDRAWTRAFLAPDVSPLMPAALIGMQPAVLASLRLTLRPGSTFHNYRHSAVSIWRANRPPALPPTVLSVADQDESALMLRNQDGVTLLPLDVTAQAFLRAIIRGGSVLDAAAAALGSATDGEIAGSWSTLLQQGAFSEFHPDGD